MSQEADPTRSGTPAHDRVLDPRRRITGYINVNYELPPLVKTLINGSMQIVQIAAVLSGLLAATSAQMYSFFKDSGNYSETTSREKRDVVVTLCYISLVLNIGATLSACMLMFMLNNMHSHAATASLRHRPMLTIPPFRTPAPADSDSEMRYFTEEGHLLPEYCKAAPTLNALIFHWFVGFAGGIAFTLAFIVTYVAIEEPKGTLIVTLVTVVYAVGPLLVGFLMNCIYSITLRMANGSHRTT
ncbi:hypothetical protein FA13DRAFT_288645 [Coprinellus micaceus]|uniref:Uncharacterized protein n=1 Tax=Coprinellus micaceus TaxID=71717 RepID=A0A4Y7TDE6_COPMI|nr:hypothetical protein FA13DRAFT_288645 [Coprinellus micaceus]